MTKVAKVIGIEKLGHEKAFILDGLADIEEGKILKRGTSVWKVIKKRWIRRPRISVYLFAPDGNYPEVGFELEYIPDLLDGEGNPPIEHDAVVSRLSFLLPLKDKVILWMVGPIRPKIGDFLTDGTSEWEVINLCQEVPQQVSGFSLLVSQSNRIYVQQGMRLKIKKSDGLQINNLPEKKTKKTKEKKEEQDGRHEKSSI